MDNINSTTYQLSESFQNFLVEISEGFLTENQFNNICAKFESNAKKYFLDNSGEANLFRMLTAIFDKKSFLIDSLKYDHHIEIVVALSSYSNYLTDIVVRNPEYLYLLFDQEIVSASLSEEFLRSEVKKSISNFKTLSTKIKMLKNLKRKYLLRIGAADLLGFKNLEDTISDLSKLARALSAELFRTCYSEVQIKYDITLPDSYCLCSLGKLGGNELNYSSDIDLILFYEENYQIDSINKDYHEIVNEAVQLFIKEATNITAESYLYRVDFRLRPDGRNSILCQSISNYIRYYETRSEDWERQMLIKLNFIDGDSNLFGKFSRFTDSFVYQKTFKNSVVDTIRRMKNSIELRLKDDINIKLIPGGIRDIEFSVQALQLMNGGKITNLKTGNTLTALKLLNNHSLLSRSEYSNLSEAYKVYRRVEHFAQLMNDTQTHDLPSTNDLLKKLAFYLGFDSSESLKNSIEEHRKKVRSIYQSIVGESSNENLDIYSQVDFENFKKSKTNLTYLSHGISLIGEKNFDKSTVEKFHKIELNLINYLIQSSSPDLVLENFVKVIRNTKLPSVWYSTFSDDKYFDTFLRLCEFSQKSIDLIVTSKELADLFLSKNVFQNINSSDTSQSIDSLLLALSVQHTTGKIKYPDFSQLLSAKIRSVCDEYILKQNLEYNYFIAGLGSFGTEEFTFGSDIDLIIVVDDLKKYPNVQSDFQKILVELKVLLKPFEVDFRLRPEGNSSPLVWDLEGYKKYIDTRMRIWEFQALSKLSFIHGSKNLCDELILKLANKLNTIDKVVIADEITKMYNAKLTKSLSGQMKIDIKNSAGGLLTIDTIISILLLNNPKLYVELVNTNTLVKIDSLMSTLP